MAESLRELKELFDLKDADLRTYSPLTLAYIGDGVYELVIRTILVKKANCPVNRLHKKASSLVKASAQSGMMEILEPLLTEEEKKCIPERKKCPFRYHGQTCDYGGLPACYRL